MDEGNELPPTETTGARFGKYRITRRLGEGAFGAVYEAVVPGPMGFAKKVAIKKIHASLVDSDPRFVQSMVNEARVGGLLHHANVVDTLEFGEVDGDYYMAMEYVDGATLAEVIGLCRKRGVLLPRFAMIDLAIQVCRGLHHAHGLRDHAGQRVDLIHRDLKPSNIIVDRDGMAKICDFGIAKAASNLYHTVVTGTVKGTPRYMSPEQIKGEGSMTAASDIFSLGAVLYEVVTGTALFHARDLPTLAAKIASVRIEAELDYVDKAFPASRPLLERALQADPADRYPDARALADDLRELGRAYPPEADMADVVGKLLPAVDRSHVRDIADSRALDLESDRAARRATPAAPSSHAPHSGHTPLPASPSSAGWQSFTAAFDSAGMVETAVHSDPDPTQAMTNVYVPPPDAADGPGETGPSGPFVDTGAATAPMSLVQPAGGSPDAPDTGRSPGVVRLAIVALVGLALLAAVALGAVLMNHLGGNEPAPSGPVHAGVAPTAVGAGVEEAAPVEAGSDGPPPWAATEPATPEPATPAPEQPARTAPVPPPAGEVVSGAEPGAISLYTRPWAEIWIDGTHVATSNQLNGHEVAGGTHTIRITCPTRDDREHTFVVDVDGNDWELGCWDFDTMAPCPQ